MSTNQKPLGVGISGLGRSGFSIHRNALLQMKDRFAIRAVFDPLPDRVQQVAKETGAKPCQKFEVLLNDPEVDLVVVASPNKMHAPQAIQALEAGKHVLCEKPFGLTTADADAMITASEKAGRVLQPFQQRRYEPDFLKVKELCHGGLLGNIHFIRIAWHGFKRRWDWQTLRSHAGGALNNNGPHPIDHALALFGEGEPQVWAEARSCLCSGDAEDHVKVILQGEGHPTVEVELTDLFAYGQDRWFVCGTAGGLRGDASALEWKWVDWSATPERPINANPTPDRNYNSEDLPWQTDTWKPEGTGDTGAGATPATQPVFDLYSDLWRTIQEGQPQAITPQSVRRRVAVMEKIRASAGIPVMSE